MSSRCPIKVIWDRESPGNRWRMKSTHSSSSSLSSEGSATSSSSSAFLLRVDILFPIASKIYPEIQKVIRDGRMLPERWFLWWCWWGNVTEVEGMLESGGVLFTHLAGADHRRAAGVPSRSSDLHSSTLLVNAQCESTLSCFKFALKRDVRSYMLNVETRVSPRN